MIVLLIILGSIVVYSASVLLINEVSFKLYKIDKFITIPVFIWFIPGLNTICLLILYIMYVIISADYETKQENKFKERMKDENNNL